jgi:hypothetical protein
MAQTKDISNQNNESLHLPLEPLFTLLHNSGFKVKPDDYIEMLKVTERFGSADIDETAKWICPIVATTETEQIKFYNIIEAYKKLAPGQKKDPGPKPPIPLWMKIAILLIIMSLLFILFKGWSKKDPFPPVGDTNIHTKVKKGDTASLSAMELFRGRESDTSRVKITWHFDDGDNFTGVTVTHVFNNTGEHIATRQFESHSIDITKTTDTAFVYVCKDIPQVELQMPADPVIVKQKVTIAALITAGPGTVSAYQWKINDSVFTSSSPVISDIVFSKEGDYSIECMAIVGNTNSPCSSVATQSLHVMDNGLHYEANFSGTGNSLSGGETKLKWWVHVLLLVPAAAGLFYGLYKRKKTGPPDNNKRAGSKEDKTGSGIKPGKPPYEIPFERNDVKIVQPERDLRSTLLQMRYKAEEEYLVLNIPGTITSTIRSGGSPQLLYAPLTRQQAYLILIDCSNPKSMMMHLFGYLAGIMIESGIPVTCFYYDKNFVCSNNHYPAGITLQRLAEIHGSATLIVMGKAHELVYRAYPVIEEKCLKELNRWEQKAIITPIPACDWSTKEKVLLQYMILLPADIMALQKLIPAIREKIKLQKDQLVAIEENTYTILQTDFRDADELKTYLNNDEVLFQWLCAICIYPRLRWEIVVETGKVILDKYGQQEKLNYSNLLKISRITWMQEGVFPQATRLELLTLLQVDNELCARQTLLRMFNYSSMLYKGEQYFFEEEKNLQQLTNEFILYSNDNHKYNRFADSKEKFKQLWQNNAVLDVPLKKYLEKIDGGNYQTPVQEDSHSVALPDYFKQDEVKAVKSLRIKRIAAAAGSSLLIAFWIYLGFWGGAYQFENPKLYQYDSSQNVPFGLVVKKNFSQCGDSSVDKFGQLTGEVNIANLSYPLVYDNKTGKAIFNIPFKQYHNGIGRLNFSWGNDDKSVTIPVVFNSQDTRDSITISCYNINTASPEKAPLYIRYNNAGAYKQMEGNLTGVLNRYTISALQADFRDASRLVYYNDTQLAMADSIALKIKQSFTIDVKPELVRENRTPPAVPILFLNLTGKDSVTSWKKLGFAELPASLNEIWTGRTGNRLLHADINNRLLWYSTNDKNTFGTYHIEEVYSNNSGTYKIIASGNNQYKLTMLRNIRPTSFEMAVCQDFVATKEELISKDEAGCGNYDRMSLYYERNAAVIYLPVTATDLVSTEKVKMDRKADTLNNPGKSLEYKMNLYSNDKYAQSSPARVRSFLTKSNIKFLVSRNNTPLNLSTSSINAANPFSRSYLVITPAPTPAAGNNNTGSYNQVQQADCSVTYYSLDEVKKSPLLICKLDLSKIGLKEMPKELFECKNMEQLTLGQTSIPEISIKTLQTALPRCKISYNVVPPKTQKDTTFRLGKEISFQSPGKMSRQDVNYINSIAAVLVNNPDSRIRLVAYYKDSYDQKDALANIAAIKNYLFAGKPSPAALQVLEQLLPELKASDSKKSAYESLPNKIATETGPSEYSQVSPTKVIIYISGFPASFSSNQTPNQSKY